MAFPFPFCFFLGVIMSNTRENENQSVKNDLNRIVREGLSRLAQFSNPRRIISRTENMNLVSKNKDRQRD